MNKTTFDKKEDREILIGNINRTGLENFPEFKAMYDALYPAYEPDSASIKALKTLVKNHRLTAVIGTWCSDSRIHGSHFLKVLDAIGFNGENLNLIAVDGEKHADNNQLQGLNIEMVPTFILYDEKGKELGRIIESPEESIEADLLKLLKKNK